MEPIPASRRAIERLDALGNRKLDVAMRRMAREVTELVPECVGLSLTIVADEVTLTMAATEPGILPLDAVQYLDGGPCVEAVEHNQVIETADVLSEERWAMDGRATAASGVLSSLSMPILDGARVVGGMNLYASTPNAFEGQHDQIAKIVGAWAPGAVLNADLSFATRLRAAEAPATLENQSKVAIALRFIASSQGVDPDTAGELLREAAARAGISQMEVARTVILFHGEDTTED
ncbi:MAG: GAF domain-containing protein [Marmoricola sp.]